jgi:glycosyltransferase involved in cell wall biosynthesis
MRILFTRQFPLEAPGGETSHLFAIAHEMKEMGIEVFLMPVTNHPTPDGIWDRRLIREVRPFGLHHTFDSFSISRAVAAFVKKTPVDAVLSWQYETAYLREFLPRRNFVHGVVAAAPFGLLKRKADTDLSRRIAYHFFHFRQLRRADVVFCPSNFAKSELVTYVGIDPQKIVVTHLSADPVFQPSAEPKNGALRNFIFSGSLEPIKGIFDAIAALGIVHQRGYRDWIFKIAGWGDQTAVRQAAIQNGIAAQIKFLGALDRPTLAAELAGADLAILPSHTDNFGLSIAEAEACGLPLVSYRVGGIPEEVDEGRTAILVELFNHQQLADAIIRLIENPAFAREMGRRGAQFMRENFSWKKAASIMVDNLEKLKRQTGNL